MSKILFLLCCSPLMFAQTPAAAPEPSMAFIRENYSKYEYRIAMRDGIKLFTAVYIPKDVASDGRTYPILLERTPYTVAPYGVDHFPANLGPSTLFAHEKFIFAYQDVRGRYMSEGDFTIVRPQKPVKNGRRTRTRARTRTTRLTGW